MESRSACSTYGSSTICSCSDTRSAKRENTSAISVSVGCQDSDMTTSCAGYRQGTDTLEIEDASAVRGVAGRVAKSPARGGPVLPRKNRRAQAVAFSARARDDVLL